MLHIRGCSAQGHGGRATSRSSQWPKPSWWVVLLKPESLLPCSSQTPPTCGPLGLGACMGLPEHLFSSPRCLSWGISGAWFRSQVQQAAWDTGPPLCYPAPQVWAGQWG